MALFEELELMGERLIKKTDSGFCVLNALVFDQPNFFDALMFLVGTPMLRDYCVIYDWANWSSGFASLVKE